MNQTLTSTFLILALTLLSPLASAHHSYAIYDIHKPVEIQGVVTRYTYGHPHPILEVQVEIEGELLTWVAEGISIRMWQRRGISTDIAVVGESISVVGWPSKDGSSKMLLSAVVRESGEEIEILDKVRQREAREGQGERPERRR